MYFKMLDILKELKQVLSYMIPVIGEGAGRAVIPALHTSEVLRLRDLWGTQGYVDAKCLLHLLKLFQTSRYRMLGFHSF